MSFGFSNRSRWKRKRGKGSTHSTALAGTGGAPANCICPQCGIKLPKEPGIPCFQRQCPGCGSPMVRQFIAET